MKILYNMQYKMNIDKHPILRQGYDVIQAIEECGASTQLTNAVIKASNFLDAVEELVDENKRLDERVDDLYNEVKMNRNEM